MKPTTLSIAAFTDKGLERDHNEDFHLFSSNTALWSWSFFTTLPTTKLSKHGCLLVVADGMGGLNAGEVASETAVNSIRQSFDTLALQPDLMLKRDKEAVLKEVTLVAHNKVVEHQAAHPETKGMGTTLVMAWLTENKVYVCWVGDSRCSLYRPSKGLVQLSKDHSYVQELVDAGKITREMAFFHPDSNIITRNLGDNQRSAVPDTMVCGLAPGDRLLLYSDGLNSMIPDGDIEKIAATEPNAEDCARRCIAEANKAGGHDNTTVIVCDVIECEPSLLPLPGDEPPKTTKPAWAIRNRGLLRALIFILLLVIGLGVFRMVNNSTKPTTNPTDTAAPIQQRTLAKPQNSTTSQPTNAPNGIKDHKAYPVESPDKATQVVNDTILTLRQIKQMKEIAKQLKGIQPKGMTPKGFKQNMADLQQRLEKLGNKELKGSEANRLYEFIQKFAKQHTGISDSLFRAQLASLKTTAEPKIVTRKRSATTPKK